MLEFSEKDHVYLLDGKVIPSCTQILQGVGLIQFNGVSPDVLQRAAAFGTACHRACHLDDLGDLDEQSLDPNLKPYLDAWRTFRGDLKFDSIEQPLWHPVYGFAGTPDRFVVGYPQPTIYDIKTGTTVYPVTAIQLAGYAILADIPTARRLVVQLKPDGKYQVHEFKERTDRGVFLSALSVYKWRIKNATT